VATKDEIEALSQLLNGADGWGNVVTPHRKTKVDLPRFQTYLLLRSDAVCQIYPMSSNSADSCRRDGRTVV
jgi:hypothetical protein